MACVMDPILGLFGSGFWGAADSGGRVRGSLNDTDTAELLLQRTRRDRRASIWEPVEARR